MAGASCATHAANWILQSGEQDAKTQIKDGTATLTVIVLDAEARTLQLGGNPMTNTTYDAKYTGLLGDSKDKSWTLDFAKPITLANSADTWTIVQIGPFAFANSKNLKAPDTGLDLTSVTNIGNGAFMYCPNFPKILLSKNLKEVGFSAFQQCYNAKFEPQLPPSLETIGHSAFAHHMIWDDNNIMQMEGAIELKGVKALHGHTFVDLPSVTSITVGPSLATVDTDGDPIDAGATEWVGRSPFAGLVNLETITFLGDAPSSLPDGFLGLTYERGKKSSGGKNYAKVVTAKNAKNTVMYFYAAYKDNWLEKIRATAGSTVTEIDGAIENGNAAVFAKWTGGNDSRTVYLALLEGEPSSETSPQFDINPSLSRTGESFTFSGTFSAGSGRLYAVFTESDGETEHVYPLTEGEVDADADETVYPLSFGLSANVLSPVLPANKTYSFAIRGENSRGEFATRSGVGTFFFGKVDVSVDKESAPENGGSLVYTVSRTGTDGDLTVPLAFSGTAAWPLNYTVSAKSVTIPDGASSANIVVTPVVSLCTGDTTLTVSTDNSLEKFFAGDSASATIKDWTEPALSSFPCTMEFKASGCNLEESASLADFPVLVRIPAKRVASIGAASGLAFFQDGKLVPHETERWSADDGGLVWVGMDRLYKDASLVCAWGKEAYENPGLAASLWSEAGYIAVWHMDETGGDSVANSTVFGSALDGAAANKAKESCDGAVGAGRVVSGELQQTGGGLFMPAPDAYLADASLFTASFWTWRLPETADPANTPNEELIAGSTAEATGNFPNGWWLSYNIAKEEDGTTPKEESYVKDIMRYRGNQAADTIKFDGRLAGEWVFIGVVMANSGESAVFRNADKKRLTWTYNPNGLPFVFGQTNYLWNKGFAGNMDEIRLRSGTSADVWIAAERESVANENYMSRAVRPGFHLIVR